MAGNEAKSPLPGYDEALSRVLRCVPVLEVERVSLREALGRVLREDVMADRDQPPFDRSAMDGFAVRSDRVRAGVSYAVTGSVAAGGLPPGASAAESGVIRIATGAPVPTPFDAVIPIELAEVVSDGGIERVTFRVGAEKAWMNVHRRAADAKARDLVLRSGTILGPQHIGIAAAVGAAKLTVSQRPRITLMTTGDEVMPHETLTDALEPQQIRNSNGPMLTAFFAAIGSPILEHVHVPDDPEVTRAAAREALSRSHLVITNGGISAGQRDWLPWAWSKLGMNVVLQGAAIQPGRPVLVCSDAESVDLRSEISNLKLGMSQSQSEIPSKLVLGLPGNPVSVLATAHLFAWPVVRLMLMHDMAHAALPWRSVCLAEPTTATSKRQVFRAAAINRDGGASVIHWHGSGDLMHTAAADGFVRLPITDAPIEAGTVVDFLPLVRS